MDANALLRIGELSRRSGVSPELLRAWERRYGLLRPTRSNGGLRLYSLDDLERVHRMRQHLAGGLAAAEAAALASAERLGEERHSLAPASAREELADALDRFDEPRAQAVLDEALAVATPDAFLGDIVLPYLHGLGERWARGDASIAQEHFASSVLRGRLLGLARGWGRGLGPLALLACLPGERHEFGLIAFGLALRSRGWRIAYLGADTPLDTTEAAARSLAPELVVLNAVDAARVTGVGPSLRVLARAHRVALGGAGAADGAPDGSLVLAGDPVAAADRVTAAAVS
jgi:MerR family transcriptional regulator, light-induced transcriptional regulator